MAKPKAVKCSICGEMIEPFLDCGEWRSGAAGPVMLHDNNGKLKPVGGRFHMECFEHAALWKRIRALEDHCGN